MTSKERIIDLIRDEFKLVDGFKFNLVQCDGTPTQYSPYMFVGGKLLDKDDAECDYFEIIEHSPFWDDIEPLTGQLLSDREREYLNHLLSGTKYAPIRIKRMVNSTGTFLTLDFMRGGSEHTPYLKYSFSKLTEGQWYSLKELGLED